MIQLEAYLKIQSRNIDGCFLNIMACCFRKPKQWRMVLGVTIGKKYMYGFIPKPCLESVSKDMRNCLLKIDQVRITFDFQPSHETIKTHFESTSEKNRTPNMKFLKRVILVSHAVIWSRKWGAMTFHQKATKLEEQNCQPN